MAQAHEHWTEQSEIYALDALDGSERSDFAAHLAGGCAICEAHLRETREVLTVLHRGLKPLTPAPGVKDRLFEQIGKPNVAAIDAARANRARPWRRLTGFLAAGIAGLVIGGTYYRLHYEPRHTVYSSIIDLLRDPVTRDHTLYGTGPTPQAKGRFLWNESGEGHIFVTNLPTPPSNKMYAVWTIPQSSAPRYVGSITTDAKGQGGLHVSSSRADKPIEVFAVTLEPLGTTSAPTGPMVLVSKPS